MKVLIVNAADVEGGAARSAFRLHHSLLGQGIASQMLVQSKSSDDFTVIGPVTKIQKALGKIRPTLDAFRVSYYKNRTKTLFSPAWVPFSVIVDKINALEPDIVHLHWIADGMLRIEDIARIKAPVVWSLHDMWPFTGGCHYDEMCGAFRKNCGNCKVLASSMEKDLSRKVFLRKQKTFAQKKDITVVGLSRWLADEASSSSLFVNYPVVNLPNPIDIQAFAPFDKAQARQLLNLPHDKKLILFGAMGATSDPRKGFAELSCALEQLKTPDAELVVFGASQPQQGVGFSQKAHYLGRFHDDVSLRVLYSAADVMLVPSLQENLSNAIMESLACGIPVVGFGIGGNADLIDHLVSGYLAEPFSIEDLANGIDWVLEHSNPGQLAFAAREKVLCDFEQSYVASQYMDLYKKVLDY
ncbi:glycosyltransferase family 4 protein [Halomonas alkalisoli]|uniref:glycosyltransferase family 4 protein n=1 Tax=Halomonas alkalisoli TaxID=2907158 RepID=UPI001F2F6D4C|nr:glycosyltransferase family 4 protein [Halomonas alkalisoli]MCE9681658.1 glycosyltransferase family 4 protein [Halomonas alkalisoli]